MLNRRENPVLVERKHMQMPYKTALASNRTGSLEYSLEGEKKEPEL